MQQFFVLRDASFLFKSGKERLAVCRVDVKLRFSIRNVFDEFVRRIISQNSRHGRVGRDESAIRRTSVHAVVGGGKNGSQPFFRSFKRLFGPFAICNVGMCACESVNLAGFILYACSPPQNPAIGSVAVHHAVFDLESIHFSFHAFHIAGNGDFKVFRVHPVFPCLDDIGSSWSS